MIDSRCPYCATMNSKTVEDIRPVISDMVECLCCGGYYKTIARVTFTVDVKPVNQNLGKD